MHHQSTPLPIPSPPHSWNTYIYAHHIHLKCFITSQMTFMLFSALPAFVSCLRRIQANKCRKCRIYAQSYTTHTVYSFDSNTIAVADKRNIQKLHYEKINTVTSTTFYCLRIVVRTLLKIVYEKANM